MDSLLEYVQLVAAKMGFKNVEEVDWVMIDDKTKIEHGGVYNKPCFHVESLVEGCEVAVKGTYSMVRLETWSYSDDQTDDVEYFAIGQCANCETIYWMEPPCTQDDIDQGFYNN